MTLLVGGGAEPDGVVGTGVAATPVRPPADPPVASVDPAEAADAPPPAVPAPAGGPLDRADPSGVPLLAAPVAGAFRLPWWALPGGVALVIGALALNLLVGPYAIPAGQVLASLTAHLHLPGSGTVALNRQQDVILWHLRLPRAVLGGLVGAGLSLSGATYQGVFRNPLADPYLLGVAAGAGLGATVVIAGHVHGGWGPFDPVAAAAFAGALMGVGLAWLVGRGAGSTPAALLLAGVAVASFLTAVQTFILQRSTDTLREVYTWILGRLTASGWADVGLLAPYVVVCGAVILAHRRHLDVLRLGDAEAASLGIDPGRVRLVLVVTASLLAAAAVAVSGLIAFVGLVVPHLVRLAVGSSYRVVLPLSALGGAAFLMTADLAGRTLASPAEIPIGVVTAFIGAPFFALVLWTSRRSLA